MNRKKMDEDKRRIKFDKETIGLSKGAKEALWYWINDEYWTEPIKNGDNVVIILQENAAFRRKIILEGVAGFPKDRDSFFLRSCNIEKQENKYNIYGELEDPIYEKREKFSIYFDDIKESVEVYNCIQGISFDKNPWNYIEEIAGFIVMKSRLSGDYCNALEKEMLPLLKELAALQSYVEGENVDVVAFPVLRKLVQKYNAKGLIKKLNKLEKEADNVYKYSLNANSITLSLCEKKWEPVWREIYTKLKESQKTYKNKVKETCKEELVYRIEKEVQDIMERYGYVGEYPDFVKKGNVKGIHLEESYNLAYFVGKEKNVVHRIHCTEYIEDTEYFTIQFLCGTAFLKEGEVEEDIYGYLFNAKGKRLFYTLYACVKVDEKDSQREINELEEIINLVVKKTELRRLTKQERIKYHGIYNTVVGDFLSFFIVGGAMYGIIMTLAMMLMGVIAAVIFGQTDKIPSLIAEGPWWIALVIGWIGFGGIMGIITVLTKRK